jgi:hypothetical protein
MFAAVNYDVIMFEGSICGTIFERYRQLAIVMQNYGHEYIVCYLGTTLEQARANIEARRALSAVTRKPFNVDLHAKKHESTYGTKAKFDAAGIRTVVVPYPDTVAYVEGLLASTPTVKVNTAAG